MSDPEAIRQFELAGWEKAAGTYGASFATATRQFIPALLDAAGVEAGLAVLDVACGPGFVTDAAVKLGAAARGLDFSPAMLRTATRLHAGIAVDHGDAEALPYPDASFDAVVSNFGLHHVPRPEMALREASRVLRPGGRVAFTAWAAPSDNVAWKLVFDAIRRCGDPAASRAPAPGGGFGSAADCRSALEVVGFGGVEARQLTGVWRHADGSALLAALRSGTARMAAMIEAQAPSSVPDIIAAIDRDAAPYRTDDELRLPISAFVASGMKASPRL